MPRAWSIANRDPQRALVRAALALVVAVATLLLPRVSLAALGPLCEAQLRSVTEAEAHQDAVAARCDAGSSLVDPLGPEAGECGVDGASRLGHAQPNAVNERAWLGAKCDGYPTVDGGCMHFEHGVAHVSSGGDGPSPDAPVLDRDAGVLPGVVPAFELSLAPPDVGLLPELRSASGPRRGERRGLDRPPRG